MAVCRLARDEAADEAARSSIRLPHALSSMAELRSPVEHLDIGDSRRRLLAHLLQDEGEPGVATEHINPRKTGDCLPLSFSQVRLWVLNQLLPDDSVYNIPAAIRLRGALDIAALGNALGEIVRRHEALRTVFETSEGQPIQIVLQHLAVEFPLIDLAQLEEGERERQVRRLGREEAERRFTLTSGPLVRARLVILAGREYVLLIDMHHIVSDGWSMGIFTREMAALYERYSDGRCSPLAELAIQYADFALWQREWLQSAQAASGLAYWKHQLEAASPVLELPAARQRPAIQSFRGGSQSVLLPDDLAESLRALCRRQGVTPFMLLLAAFKILLCRYTGQFDIVVGTPIANRNRRDVEPLIGFFLNTLVLRTDLSGNPPFLELLAQVRQVALEAFAHQDVPFELLVQELQPQRDLSRTPLFQVMFNMLNFAETWTDLPRLTTESIESTEIQSKFDLTVFAAEGNGSIEVTAVFNADLFDSAAVTKMLTHFQTLLSGIVAGPQRRILELPLLPEGESLQVRTQGVAVVSDASFIKFDQDSVEQSIWSRFEQQASKYPAKIAIETDLCQWTYADLRERAAGLAGTIISARGMGSENIPLLIQDDALMIVAILAVLSSGKAYVPLDPGYPEDRLEYMLQDCGAGAILTDERSLSLARRLDHGGRQIVLVEDRAAALAIDQLPVVSPDSLAYILYTSGSTGQPKGVVQNNRNVLHHIRSYTDSLCISSRDKLTSLSSYSFDASVMDIFGALLNGATLCRFAIKRSGLDRLSEWMVEREISIYHSTPSVYRHFVRTLGAEARFPSLRLVVLGGEEVLSSDVESYKGHFSPECILVNGFGPTESTLALQYFIGPDSELASDTRRNTVPVGYAVQETEVLLLNEAGVQVADYGLGEIAIRSEYVALGYWGKPTLSESVFAAGRIGLNCRTYLTGDIGRLLPDHGIEYVGRRDHQVKVRGFRVEPGEIESVVAIHPDVQTCVVVPKQTSQGDTYLIGYVTAVQPAKLTAADLITFSESKLPDYMVPSFFSILEKMPLTVNGKINRHALVDLDESRLESRSVDLSMARTPVEEIMAGIFAEVLGIERVGLDQNFFELGGHSLSAMLVVSRVRRAFGLDLQLRVLFEEPTVAFLSAFIERDRSVQQVIPPRINQVLEDCMPASASGRHPDAVASPDTARQAGVAGRPLTFPLSFAQQRLYFLDQLYPASSLYNIPAAVRLKGRLSCCALEQGLAELVNRQASLRTTFGTDAEEPVQVIARDVRSELVVADLAGLQERERELETTRLAREQAERPFDLARGPVLRTGLLRLAASDYLLFFTMHHIASDGWSIAIFIKEISAIYRSFSAGLSVQLDILPIQYVDFSVWQRERLTGDFLESQLGYWKQKLSGAPLILALPTDRPRPAVQTYSGQVGIGNLPGELSAEIGRLSRQQGVTKFMTLLTAFSVLLCRYAGQAEILVGTPVANRDLPELENIIGFFANTLVLRVGLQGDPTFSEFIARVRETTLEAFAHRELPFEKLVEELNPERSLSHSPLFQVVFVLQNLPVPFAEVEGLSMELLDLYDGTSKFDLTLSITETSMGSTTRVEYNPDLFDASTVARLAAEYRILLEHAVIDREQPISLLPLLSEAARHQVWIEWNEPSPEPSGERCLHESLQQWFERTPDSIATVFGSQMITYAELNARANQLGNYLRKQGVGSETLVVIYTQRSLQLIVGIAGILKAGGAYVPLDPAYPKERLAYVLDDVRSPIVLTEAGLAANLPETNARVFCLDRDWTEAESESRLNPGQVAASGNAAYVIYTSGTTGQPKGVVVTHRNVLRLFGVTKQRFSFDGRDVWTLFHSQAFDFSVWEIWGALLHGGKLIVVPYLVSRSPDSFYNLVRAETVTILNQTPSAFRHFIQEAVNAADGELSLRCIIFGGEALELKSLRPWAEHYSVSGPQLINMYGITETTVHVAYQQIAIDDIEKATGSLIGRPIGDMELYILDNRMQIAPIGVAGEVYVGGAGLARGYLNHSDLTAERFIPSGLSSAPGSRLYTSGDLGRYRTNAGIEYLGRSDDQVKIRGFRVEPGEIESLLVAELSVRQAVVIARREEPGDTRLVAYVVPETGSLPTAGSLRSALTEKLPDYMVPYAFVFLESLPITANGKLDKTGLPAPGHARPDLVEAFAPPSTGEESILAQVWGEVLCLERVGVNDNFFALGGDSIRSMRVKASAEQKGLSFRLEDIFLHQTIRGLARVVKAVENNGGHKRRGHPFALVGERDRGIVPQDIGDAYPLARLQAQMLLYNNNGASSTYHDVFSFHVRCRLDLRTLGEAAQQILDRHAVLRTGFDLTSFTEPLQLVHKKVDAVLEIHDLAHLTPQEQERELRRWREGEVKRAFDWTRPPLIRFYVHLRGENEFQFSTSFHHAILDGWSHASLLTELFQRYLSLLDKGNYPVSPSPIVSYSDFVSLEQEAIDCPESKLYWMEKLEGADMTVLPRRAGGLAPESRSALRGLTETIQLTDECDEKIGPLAETLGVPLKSILLASHLTVLSRLARQSDVVTGLICNGRPERAGGDRVLGLFLNLIPFRLELVGGTWIDLIRETFEAEREALSYRRYPLAELLRSRDGRPLFETFFNYIDFHVYQGLLDSNEIEVVDTRSFEEMEWAFGAYFSPGESHTYLSLHYHGTQFSSRQIRAIGRCYRNVLAEIALHPGSRYET
jgi:amino acid adenylation domain-containing protein